MIIETTIEEPAQILYLSRTPEQAGEMKDALTLGQGLADKDELGNPIKYKWARCAKIGGKYMSTVKDPKTGKLRKAVLDCSASNVNQWLKAFEEFKKAGIKVPITKGHFERTSDDGRGYGIDLRKNNGWLEANMQLIGDDAIKSAGRNEVSIGVKPNYTDRDGREFGDAIEHIALTLFPVVPGQSTANQTNGLLAASRADGEEEPIVFTLSAAPDEPPATPAEAIPMADKTALSKTHRAAMCKALSMDDDPAVDDESLMSKHIDRHAALQRDRNKVEPLMNAVKNMSMESVLGDWGAEEVPELHKELSHLQEIATTAAAERDALAGQVKNLSQAEVTPDPEYLRGYADLAIGRIDLAMERGDMPSAIANRLKNAVLVGDSKEPSVFMLSRDDDLGERPIEFVLKLFNGAKLAPVSADGVHVLSQDDNPNAGVDVNKPEGHAESGKALTTERRKELLGSINIPVPATAK